MSSPKFDLIVRRLGATLALAIVLACIISVFSEDEALALFLPSWVALMVGWPYLSRRLGFDFPKPPAPRDPRARSTSAMLLVITAALAMILGVVAALTINAQSVMILFIPFWLAFWLVLYYGWPYLSRQVPFLDFDKAPTTQVPKRPLWLRLIRGTLAWIGAIGLALVLNWKKDGSYGTYDLAAGRYVSLTESEAIERLHTKLHDGYKWRFCYRYVNITPMHISFSVVFGPDGRVTEVKPVYGWD